MDRVLSALALVLLAPFFVVIALLIKLDSPGPVFYRHDRLARGGRSFGLFKFRTMGLEYCRGEHYGGAKAEIAFRQLMDDPEHREQFSEKYKLAKDPRVTRFGDFLRRTSLDELPQLLNVFLGDISLVGPRPITTDELKRYGVMAEQLLDIHPGVTGYWQINGRSQISYEERVRLDLLYVSNWSVGLDLSIMAKTFRVLVSRFGAC
jgi:undecaprenyl-phosphate galactose phosphotransferase